MAGSDREWERIRWQCRRGMLEVDIVLQRFLDRYAEQLEPGPLISFKEILEIPDNDLWDLISGRSETNRPDWQEVLGLLRNI
ncbi:MAG: succinate dehydrogenase assembly factor 2 [Burkholderiales bacterium]